MGKGKKPILRFLLKLFWGKFDAGMTYRPKEVRVSGNHWVHAMRERESTHTVTGKGATADKQTK